MSNLFFQLPVGAANGPGTAVDVSALGALKTLVVAGSWTFTPNISIEINNSPTQDGSWAPIGDTLQGAGLLTVQVSCLFMRARVSNFKGGQAPEVWIGGPEDAVRLAVPSVSGLSGVGAAFSISSMGPFKTVQVGGAYGGAINIEVSQDGGLTWGTAFSFQTGEQGAQSALVVGDFMRVKRSGVPTNPDLNPGTPVVTLSASGIPGQDQTSGTSSLPYPQPAPVSTTIFVRTTGDDLTGNGESVATAYRTWQRAVLDVPLYINGGYRWIIDCSGIGTEIFPPGYVMPAIKSAVTLNTTVTVAQDAQFRREGAIKTRADLQLFSPIPVGDCTITSADILTLTPGARSRVYLLTLKPASARASWAANACKGAIFTAQNVQGAGDAVVDESTTTTLLLTLSDKNTGFTPTAPYVLKEQSATFSGTSATDGTGGAAFNIFNVDSFSFNGIKFVNTGGPAAVGVGLRCSNPGYNFSYCDFSNAQIWQGLGQYRILLEQCYFHGGATYQFQGANMSIGACLIDGVVDWQSLPGSGTASFNDTICNAWVRPVGEARGQGGNFNQPSVLVGGGIPTYGKFCIVKNGLSHGVAPKGGGSWEFFLSQGNAGDAFRVDNSTGPVQLTNAELLGTGAGGIALNLLNGAQVNANAACVIVGTTNDYKVGANAGSAAAGAGFAALAAETDLAAGLTSQLCRLTKS